MAGPVLKNRQGSAVSLGAVLLWVANRLDLPLLPVIFPTQLILRIECPDGEIWLINPFNGESLSEHMLDVWLKEISARRRNCFMKTLMKLITLR